MTFELGPNRFGRGTWLVLAAAIFVASPSLALAACPAGDAECNASEPVANAVVDELDNGRVHEMWNQNVGTLLKAQITENGFLAASTGPVAILSIGVSSRSIIQQGPAVDQMTGKPFYGRLYKVTLSSGAVYFETISLVREGSTYKLLGLYLVPSPTK